MKKNKFEFIPLAKYIPLTKFIPLTCIGGIKAYTKADAIVHLLEDEDKTYVYTINDDRPLIVKESMDEILAKIEEVERRRNKYDIR